MEILALLFALSPILATLVFWVYKMSVRPSEKHAETTLHVQEVAPVVQVAPVTVAAGTSIGTSNEDEIAVVLAAAANIYVKSTT